MNDELSVSVTKFGALVHVNVVNGVPRCPHCGDQMLEVDRDDEQVLYQCRSSKAIWDWISG